jgi:hypothetical protein
VAHLHALDDILAQIFNHEIAVLVTGLQVILNSPAIKSNFLSSVSNRTQGMSGTNASLASNHVYVFIFDRKQRCNDAHCFVRKSRLTSHHHIQCLKNNRNSNVLPTKGMGNEFL